MMIMRGTITRKRRKQMKKNRMLSLLAVLAFIVSIYASAALAENGWDGDNQQYTFISVPSDADISYLFDGSFDDGALTESDDSAADTATGQPTAAPVETVAPTLPQMDASSGASEFILDGKELVKYQGRSSMVFVPEGVTVIRGGAFAGNRNITTVYLPDSVVKIESGAFTNCANLLFISFSGNSKLSEIGENAFAGCPLLNTSFAVDVKNVSDGAFEQTRANSPATQVPSTPKPTPTMKPTPANPAVPFGNPLLQISTPIPGSLKITQQPVSQQAAEGDFVMFIVVAEGTGNIQYQWMRSKDGGVWSKIENTSQPFENAATNVLSFTATAVRAGYKFKCVITDGVNRVESNVVSVRMDPQSISHGGTVSSDDDPWGDAAKPTSVPSTYDQLYNGQLDGALPQVQAKQISNTSAQISWTKMQSATGYELYRYSLNKNTYDEDFTLLGTFSTTSYVDQEIDLSNWEYTYSVKAVLTSLDATERRTTDYSIGVKVQALSAPTNVTALQITEDSAQISWSPSELASYYKLFRSVNDGRMTVLVASLTDTQYIDTGLDFSNNTYKYQVQAEMIVPGSDTPVRRASKAVQTEEFSKVGQSFENDRLVYTIADKGVVVTGYKGGQSTLSIPSSVKYRKNTYTVIAIGPNVFWGNKTLTKITLPSTIQVIESGAFAYCSAIIDQ